MISHIQSVVTQEGQSPLPAIVVGQWQSITDATTPVIIASFSKNPSTFLVRVTFSPSSATNIDAGETITLGDGSVNYTFDTTAPFVKGQIGSFLIEIPANEVSEWTIAVSMAAAINVLVEVVGEAQYV